MTRSSLPSSRKALLPFPSTSAVPIPAPTLGAPSPPSPSLTRSHAPIRLPDRWLSAALTTPLLTNLFGSPFHTDQNPNSVPKAIYIETVIQFCRFTLQTTPNFRTSHSSNFLRAQLLSRVWLCDPMDCRLPGSKSLLPGFPTQEYWSCFPLLLQGIVLTQGSNRSILHWQADSWSLSHLGNPTPPASPPKLKLLSSLWKIVPSVWMLPSAKFMSRSVSKRRSNGFVIRYQTLASYKLDSNSRATTFSSSTVRQIA